MAIILAACGTVPDRKPLPVANHELAGISGLPENVRDWGDETSPEILKTIKSASSEDVRKAFPAFEGDVNFLAISGGGQDGAFGAGLLNGWTISGTRPDFQIVTGISTGALIAPFAFLGPEYDPTLKAIYSTLTTADIVERRSWTQIATGDAAFDTSKFRALIERYIDDEMLRRLANEHASGRRLFIGTTNLDARRPVIWNITAIAASNYLGKKSLIAKILLASASIPGAFPPVLFEVNHDGVVYDELHVDGGIASQVFIYPGNFDMLQILHKIDPDKRHKTFIIRNSLLKPRPNPVNPDIFTVSGVSISSLIQAQGVGDLYRIYQLTKRDGGEYRLAYIPDDFDQEATEMFDRDYMNTLYNLGFEMAKKGYPWRRAPPNFSVGSEP